MPTRRPNLRDHAVRQRPPSRGRDAIYNASPSQPSAVARLPQPVDRKRSAAGWDESHRRVTFYCPLDLLEGLEKEVGRSRRSKTAVIVEAIREHLL